MIDVANNPCVNEILTKLQQKDMQRLTVPDIGGLAGIGHLSQGILDLFDKSGDYDLTFKVAEAGSDGNGNPRNASTIGTSDRQGGFNFTVTLDDDYVRNATQLAIARTIIHESMHAYLGYVLQKNFLSDTARLLREYSNRFNDANITEHTFIAEYVEAIGHSLSVWANDVHNLEYYQNLAWSGGLIGTEAFNRLSDEKQRAIRNANRAEGDAVNRANRNARGTKCD